MQDKLLEERKNHSQDNENKTLRYNDPDLIQDYLNREVLRCNEWLVVYVCKHCHNHLGEKQAEIYVKLCSLQIGIKAFFPVKHIYTQQKVTHTFAQEKYKYNRASL